MENMEGRGWENGENELGEIKKGPWKAEEDEVLINHVNKYGPRNWSSIRSKGLLQRTGKSCRLRWVNKLRPDLKNGVKFSAEEERIVIDLQAQFGNKWAKIATYLPGRTDNDVKNFWSSRQKRLARILHNSTPQSGTSQGDNNVVGSSVKEVPALHDVPSLEAPQFRSSTYEESLSNPQSCSSTYIDNFAAFPMLDLMNPTSFTFEPNLLQLEYTPCETKPFNGSKLQLPFPQIPQVQTDFPLPLEGQDFTLRSGNLYCSDVFGSASAPEPERSCLNVANSDVFGNASAPEPVRSCLDIVNPDVFGNASTPEPERSCLQDVMKQETDAMINPVSPDSFSDDFPIDMFDHVIEPLPSPSDW